MMKPNDYKMLQKVILHTASNSTAAVQTSDILTKHKKESEFLRSKLTKLDGEVVVERRA